MPETFGTAVVTEQMLYLIRVTKLDDGGKMDATVLTMIPRAVNVMFFFVYTATS